MTKPTRSPCWFAVVLAVTCVVSVCAEAPKQLDEIRTKTAVYRDVRVISRNPSSITVRHAGGITQIPFEEMSPELQAEFGYEPEKKEAFEEQLRREAEATVARQAGERAAREAEEAAHVEQRRIDKIAQDFATPPELGGVDMRPRLRELELFVKDQGRSPSCAVFAIVSALELQYYEVTGKPEKLSEQYLIWATNQVAGSRNRIVIDQDGVGSIDDAGYSLLEVFQALGRYGIPTHNALEQRLGSQTGVGDMPADLIAKAQKRRGVIAYSVPGRDKAEVARNMVHVLNNGLPVILALRWPHQNGTQGGLLSSQIPIQDYAHAVTVVGYSSETGKPEDLRFIFKNSWGPKWGAYGYGFVDIGYLSKYLLGAVFIDLLPPPAAGG